jgi:glycosyltransferase involved in cell wall biosynthesis
MSEIHGRPEHDTQSDPCIDSLLFVAWKDLAHPEAGGSEIYVDELLCEFQRRGKRVALVCGDPVEQRGYRVLGAGSKFGQYLRAPFVARRSGQWDLLVEVVNGFPFFTPFWWRGPRICVFHHVHDGQWFRYFPKPIAAIGWFIECGMIPLLYPRTVFVAVSPSTAKRMQEIGIDSSRIYLAHNGLDPSFFEVPRHQTPEFQSGVPTFVTVGRLAANKGLDRLLDAWAIFVARNPGRLLVIGDGPERDRLEARGVTGVEFLGRIDEPVKRQIIRDATMLLHSAFREGWGLVIIEAAALGTPAVAFDADGVRDAVRDGLTGRLVNSSEEMASVLTDLVTGDVEVVREMSQAAKEWAAMFTWSRTADELLVAASAAILSK